MNRPIFIVSCPRSGSQLLFETLRESPMVWTIGGESHAVFASLPQLDPRLRGFESGRLDAADASPAIAATLEAAWVEELRDRDATRLRDLPAAQPPPSIRFLEKTPNSCLRIPFLKACFPDALFVFLHREPRSAIASLTEGWMEAARSGRFITFRHVPRSTLPYWCFFLPPGWRTVAGLPVVEIAAYQWRLANQFILDDLATLPEQAWTWLTYEAFVNDPGGEVARLCAFLDIAIDGRMRAHLGKPLPLSRTVVAPPDRGKWQRHEEPILGVLPKVADIAARLAALARDRPPQSSP